MTKELKRAVQEVQTLPAKDQDAIGRQVRYHVEKLRVLRGAVDAGIRALDEGHGQEVEIEDLIRVLPAIGMRRGGRPRAIVQSPLGTQDLLDIWIHLEISVSAEFADEQLRAIGRAWEVLAEWRDYGRTRDEVCEGLRSVRCERYVIFYRVKENAVEIVRVLDERRDVNPLFLDDEVA